MAEIKTIPATKMIVGIVAKVAADLESRSALGKSLGYFIVESRSGFSESILR